MISRSLAEFVVGTRFEDLPPETVGMARLCFLDWLGSAISGGSTRAGKIVKDYAMELGGPGQATVIGRPTRVSPFAAALANGAQSHTIEMDDVHNASILHPAAVVIPAALAAAEKVGASGRDLLRALVVGYDVAIRVGEAVTPSHYEFWHTTGTCGTFGAAAAAGSVLGLEVGQLVHALGNAGTQASGLWQFLEDGAMSKCLHTGKAAANGLLAAELAARGFTGATHILEGPRGFFRATAAEYDESVVTHELGERFHVMEVSFKLYPSCRHTHAPVDCALKLVTEGLDYREIDRIRVSTNAVAAGLVSNLSPRDAYSAKFSAQYCVAAALKYGYLTETCFEPAALDDPDLRQLAALVELVVDPELEARYPARWSSMVEVFAGDDRRVAQVDDPHGDPGNPASMTELEAKFRSLAQPVVGEDLTERLVHFCGELDGVDNMSSFGLLWEGK